MSKFREYKGSDSIFLEACRIAQVDATHRQFRKWDTGRGSAFGCREEARKAIVDRSRPQTGK